MTRGSNREPVSPPTQPFQQPDALLWATGSGELVRRRRGRLQAGCVEKPVDALDVPRLQRMCCCVLGEHAAEKERKVAKPPADGGSLGVRHHLQQLRQTQRVELAVAPPAPPARRPLPHAPAGNPRVGREQLCKEGAVGVAGQELQQTGNVEHRHGSGRAEPLFNEHRVFQVIRDPVDQHGESKERRCREQGVTLGDAREQRLEQRRAPQQLVELRWVTAQLLDGRSARSRLEQLHVGGGQQAEVAGVGHSAGTGDAPTNARSSAASLSLDGGWMYIMCPASYRVILTLPDRLGSSPIRSRVHSAAANGVARSKYPLASSSLSSRLRDMALRSIEATSRYLLSASSPKFQGRTRSPFSTSYGRSDSKPSSPRRYEFTAAENGAWMMA